MLTMVLVVQLLSVAHKPGTVENDNQRAGKMQRCSERHRQPIRRSGGDPENNEDDSEA